MSSAKQRTVWHTLQEVFKRIQPPWVLFAISLVCVPLIAWTATSQPRLLLNALRAAQSNPGASLSTALVTYAWIAGLDVVFRFCQSLAVQFSGLSVVTQLRQQLFETLMRMPLPKLDAEPAGKWVSRTLGDCDALSDAFASGAVLAIVDLAIIVFTLVSMFWLSPPIATAALLVLPPTVFFVRRLTASAQATFRGIRESIAKVSAAMAEQVEGIAVVTGYQESAHSYAQFAEVNDEHRKANYASIRYDALLFSVIESAASIALASLLCVWIWGTRSAAEALVCVAMAEYLQRLFVPLRDLSQKFNGLQYAYAAAERVGHVLGHEPLKLERTNTLDGSVELDHITFAHSNREALLCDLSLRIPAGQYLAIVGPSGSGKSTLLALILGLYEAQKGRVSQPRSEDCFALVTQEPLLFEGTLTDNITLFETPDAVRLDDVMKTASLTTLAERLVRQTIEPDQSGLSIGEKQLIMVARALYLQRPCLVLDEATASVDSATEAAIEAAVLQKRGSTTIIQIAHRLSTIQRADRILVMDEGRIIESGTHDELLAFKGMYARLHKIEALSTTG